jgi:N-acetylglucosamine-6-phosphate deacetylase
MSDTEVIAWHYATRQPVRFRWNDRQVVSLTEAPETQASNLWIAPSLFDLQINGYAGIDFQQDQAALPDLLKAARKLRADGCSRWLLTLITEDWTKLMARLRRFREIRAQSPELQSAIVGWHIEGPFLSAQAGFAGAHRAAVMCDPSPGHIVELRQTAGPDPVLLTLAPERKGSAEAIKRAVALGIKVSLGHTNASAEQLRDAVSAGATGFTHLGNGCPRELDRHDNILWRVLDAQGLTVSFIVDGVHVSPPLLRLAHRALPPDRIYYTTDAMAAAGSPPGRYRIGHLEVEVGPDKIVRQPGSPLFAGSALRPLEGVQRASAILGKPWQETWAHFSDVPNRFLGMEAGIKEGRPATFCLLRVTPQNQIQSLISFVEGRSDGA